MTAEAANYVGNTDSNPPPNSYNPEWQSNSSSAWDRNVQGYKPSKTWLDQQNRNKAKEELKQKILSQGASIRNLEVQLGQLVAQMNSMATNTASDNLEQPHNLTDQCKAVGVVHLENEDNDSEPDWDSEWDYEEESARLPPVHFNVEPTSSAEASDTDEEELYKSGSDSENGSQRDRDPGCLSIPLTIGNTHFPKALIDSGAGLNLMALCTARRIGLGEPGNSTRQIIFGDNSVGAVKGVYLDIWVKIGEICLLTDFHVLDICEDPKTPIILGRPFMATGKMMLDIKSRVIKLSTVSHEVTYMMLRDMPYLMEARMRLPDEEWMSNTRPPEPQQAHTPSQNHNHHAVKQDKKGKVMRWKRRKRRGILKGIVGLTLRHPQQQGEAPRIPPLPDPH